MEELVKRGFPSLPPSTKWKEKRRCGTKALTPIGLIYLAFSSGVGGKGNNSERPPWCLNEWLIKGGVSYDGWQNIRDDEKVARGMAGVGADGGLDAGIEVEEKDMVGTNVDRVGVDVLEVR